MGISELCTVNAKVCARLAYLIFKLKYVILIVEGVLFVVEDVLSLCSVTEHPRQKERHHDGARAN